MVAQGPKGAFQYPFVTQPDLTFHSEGSSCRRRRVVVPVAERASIPTPNDKFAPPKAICRPHIRHCVRGYDRSEAPWGEGHPTSTTTTTITLLGTCPALEQREFATAAGDTQASPEASSTTSR